MQGMNIVIFGGHLGADPETRYTQGGQAVMTMRIAASEKWKGKDGQQQERTEWISAVLWGARAEALGKILSKGDALVVQGRLQTRSWEDKDGNKRYTTEINVSDVKLCGSRGGSSGGGQRGGRGGYDQGGGDFGGYDDSSDIPF